jgi:hypothetical protein
MNNQTTSEIKQSAFNPKLFSPTIIYNMEDFLRKLDLSESSFKFNLATLKTICNNLNDRNYTDLDFLISKFNEVKNYLNEKNLETRKRYSTVIRTILPALTNFDNKTISEYITKYLNIVSASQKKIRHIKNPPKSKALTDSDYENIVQPLQPQPQQPTVDRPARQHSPIVINLKKQYKQYIEDVERPSIKDVNELIDNTSKKFTQNETTVNSYNLRMKQMLREFEPQQHNLDFLVRKPEDVISFMDKQSSLSLTKAYYSAIIAFVKYSNLPEHDKNNVIEQYRAYLKSKPNKEEFVFDQKKYKDYTWDTLRNHVNNTLIPNETDPMKRIIMSLYINGPPRRTKDYTYMLINGKDDKKNNVLIFTPQVKRFIFNRYKNIVKNGPQQVDIVNENLIRDIQTYLNTLPKGQTYLLQSGNEPLTDTQLVTKMNYGISKKYNVPVQVNVLRHLFANYLSTIKVNPRKLTEFARLMGTSVNMIVSTYIDDLEHDNNYDVNALGVEEQKENEIPPLILQETPSEKRKRLNREKYVQNRDEEARKRRERDQKRKEARAKTDQEKKQLSKDEYILQQRTKRYIKKEETAKRHEEMKKMKKEDSLSSREERRLKREASNK